MESSKKQVYPLHPKQFVNKILNWDSRVFIKFYRLKIPWNGFLRRILIIGDVPIWVILSLFFMVLGTSLSFPRFETSGILLFTCILFAGLTLIVPKVIVNRKRPYADTRLLEFFNIEVENRDPTFGSKEQEGFPSGHAFFTWLALPVFTYTFGWYGFIVFGLLAFPMPILRCNLGVHFPTDTIAGALLGLITAAISILLFPVAFYPFYMIILDFLQTAWGWTIYFVLGLLVFMILFFGRFRK